MDQITVERNRVHIVLTRQEVKDELKQASRLSFLQALALAALPPLIYIHAADPAGPACLLLWGLLCGLLCGTLPSVRHFTWYLRAMDEAE